MKAISGEGAGRRRLLFLATLFSLALYIDSLSYDFVWDDDVLIVNNQYTKYFRYLPAFFTWDFSRWKNRISTSRS